MRLYGYFRSSATYRVRIALGLKSMEYENAFLDPRRGENRRTDYLALNPLGLIPSLEDESEVFVQSMAIIEYLNETIPEPPLLPGHPADRARIRALAQYVCCDIHPLDNLRVLQYLRGPLERKEEAVLAWYRHWIVEGFDAIENMLANDDRTGQFCHGDEPGLADICLVPQFVNAELNNVDLGPYPTIRRIYEACMTLDAFISAHPRNQPDAEIS